MKVEANGQLLIRMIINGSSVHGGFDSNLEVNTVSVWDSNHYSPRKDVRLHKGMVLVHSVASHDDLIAVGGQCSMMDDTGEVKIVSLFKLDEIESLKFPLWVYSVEFFQPTVLATACMIGDTANAIAQLRDMRCRDSGILLAESEENRGIRTLNCHPTNRNLIAIGGDDVGAIFDVRKPLIPAVQLWDKSSADSGYLHTIRWSPNGKYLAASGMYGIDIWNCQGSVTRNKGYHAPQLDDLTFFNQCLWMDDEENILSGDTDGVIHVWNRKNDEKMMLKSYRAEMVILMIFNFHTIEFIVNWLLDIKIKSESGHIFKSNQNPILFLIK